MNIMDLHLFVASCVYAGVLLVTIIYLIWLAASLCDTEFRAQLKRGTLRGIRRILRRFIKTES